MPIFPLSQPLNDRELMKTTCHLYRISLLQVLPYGLICVAIMMYFRFGKMILPVAWQPYHAQSAMFALVLLLPFLGAIITTVDAIAKNPEISLVTILKETGERFLSLMGALASIALVPMILMGLCTVAYFTLDYYHLNFNLLFAWIVFSLFLIFTSVVTVIYAPWLIFSDGLDANDAQDKSKLLVKNYFLRTFSHALLSVLIIAFLIKLPVLIPYYFKGLYLPSLGIQLIAMVALVVIGPWPFVFLLTDKYDLQIRKKDELNDPDHKARKQKMPSAIPANPSNKNVSF